MKPSILVIIIPGSQLAFRETPADANPFSTHLYSKYKSEKPATTKKWKA